MRRALVRHLMLGSAAIFLALAAGAEEEKSLLKNGGFEEVTQVAGVAEGGGKYGRWTLKGGPHAPAHWTLSSHFGGELSILSERAPEGKQFLRIESGAEREAHVVQPCSEIKSGGYYGVSVRYRGGPVLIKAYEYSEKGGGPHIETIATGRATGHDDEWSRIEGLYYPLRSAKVSIVAAVAAGCVADIDDVRVWQIPETPPDARGWLNVKDFGASGSAFTTTATTTAGSEEVIVKDVGDFKADQWVSISKCNIRYDRALLCGPGSPYRDKAPLGDAVDIRGYDGSQGSWFVYILEIESADPLTFRWSDDLVQGRKWKATKVPVTRDWQKLSNGLEVKFNKRDLQPGHMIVFDARDQLVTKIEKIDGNKLILRDKANRSVKDVLVRHSDSAALQTAMDLAIKQKRNLFVPNGHYRLTRGIQVCNANIQIEGESGVSTVMDISEGRGAIFALQRGKEVTIRNFRMIGHTGLADKPGSFRTSSGHSYWVCALKSCQAVTIGWTERVLVENCHASRMSAEAFYCHGSCRVTTKSDAFTKSLTFLRCSATDCAANGFNNNDRAENTCVLYCRIDGVGWHAYEGPGRFIKLVGNYVRNAGPFTIGGCVGRPEYLNEIGAGQAVIANNVFEGCDGGNGGIAVQVCPRQVTIANNLFINYNGPAIRLSSYSHSGGKTTFPVRNAVITGNIIDLTYHGEKPKSRWGIHVNASDVTVADNQIYVRGEGAPAHGIKISESARNVTVHDNLIRNCGYGIYTTRQGSTVSKVIDPLSFLDTRLPLVWATSHCYRGWDLVWTSGASKGKVARIDALDPKTTIFKLAKAHDLNAGDHFEIIPADGANWNIHDNTITGCAQPVVFDSYGSNTSFLKNNIITRGTAKDVKQAIQVAGRFNLIGNHICGFDEKDSAALTLSPDPAGRKYRNLVLRNIFERCSTVVKEAGKGLWDGTMKSDNVFISCGDVPDSTSAGSAEQKITPVAIAPPKKPEFLAPKLRAPVKIDGDVSEWPWADKARVATLERGPSGDPISSPKGYACAAYDDSNLYMVMRFELPKGAKLKAERGFDRGDGVEVSFQNADPKHPTPIFLLWGSVGGTHEGSAAMGASAEQAEALRKATVYAAKRTPTGWACEWRIPFSAMGLKAANAKTLFFNMGLSCTAKGSWVVWAPTGGRVCDVANAGKLHLRRSGKEE